MNDLERIAKYMGLSKVTGSYYHEHIGKATIDVWMKAPPQQTSKMICLYSDGKKNYTFKTKLSYNKVWGELLPVVRAIKNDRTIDSLKDSIEIKMGNKLRVNVRDSLLSCRIPRLYAAVLAYVAWHEEVTNNVTITK